MTNPMQWLILQLKDVEFYTRDSIPIKRGQTFCMEWNDLLTVLYNWTSSSCHFLPNPIGTFSFQEYSWLSPIKRGFLGAPKVKILGYLFFAPSFFLLFLVPNYWRVLVGATSCWDFLAIAVHKHHSSSRL